MLVTCRQMSEAEDRLFSNGASPEPYMDDAGRQCAEAIQRFFPRPSSVEVFVGKGNNGGDALVVARRLKERGWRVNLNFSHGPDEISELAAKKLREFENSRVGDSRLAGSPLVVVDGLLGIGAKGDLRGGIREQADRINTLRRERFATCFAIDIPTGLNADTGVPGEGAVRADYTLSICLPKAGFAADEAIDHVGRLVEIPLDIPVAEGDDSRRFLFPSNLLPRLERRLFDTHKGHSGRVVVVAGSRGMAGAAILVAQAASRTGSGLVTVCVLEDIYPVVAANCSPEIMVRPVKSHEEAGEIRCDVLAIGPGLGSEFDDAVLELVSSHEAAAVVDADGLNALSRNKERLKSLPSNRMLTPHPGELARLTDRREGRVDVTRVLADEWGVTLLHKGARTAIASPGRPVELNTTGHPGMASGGMGDVLTGVCASLAGQGLDLHDAACVGSWLLGSAAEAARDREGVAAESVTAATVFEHLGHALGALHAGTDSTGSGN
ncbi:MAG: NAD(P)H-hydrate dehydratase [Verrucomicrobiales bacterium]